MDRQQQAILQAQDTKILQKINAPLLEAFKQRYPQQVEHCLRLTMERLQAGLDKRGDIDVADPDTWRMSTVELQELARTAYYLDQIRQGI